MKSELKEYEIKKIKEIMETQNKSNLAYNAMNILLKSMEEQNGNRRNKIKTN